MRMQRHLPVERNRINDFDQWPPCPLQHPLSRRIDSIAEGNATKNNEFRYAAAALRDDGISKEDDNTGGSSQTLFNRCSPIAQS